MRRLMICATVSALVGCGSCGEQARGEISFVVGDVSSVGNAEHDFGSVFMGRQHTVSITVRNSGDAPFTIDRIERQGDERFSAPLVTPVTLQPDRSTQLQVVFDAPEASDASVLRTTHHATFSLALAKASTDTATVTVDAVAERSTVDCTVPNQVSFGRVVVGEVGRRSVTLFNPSGREIVAHGSPVTGDTNAFRYAPDSPTGDFTVPASGDTTVTFELEPAAARPYTAEVKLRVDRCPDTAVLLQGEGIEQALTFGDLLDFGFAPPGTSVARQVVFTNLVDRPVRVTEIEIEQTGALFATLADAAVVVPGATSEGPGSAVLPVTFRPVSLGQRQAQLRFKTNLDSQPSGEVQLVGFGGGPDLKLTPDPLLDFGPVPYFDPVSGSPPFFAVRTLTIANLGVLPSQPDPDANLHLGQGTMAPWADGVTRKFFEVRAKAGTGARDGELCVGRFDAAQGCLGDLAGYDNQRGLDANAASSLAVPVRFTPADDQPNKEWELIVFSNDGDRPAAVLTVRASVQRMMPCTATVTPAILNFGLLSATRATDLSLVVHNASSNDCLLSGLELSPGSDQAFSLPNGAVPSQVLPGLSRMVVPVRAMAKGSVTSAITTVTGGVRFGVSDPANPQREVLLSAQTGASCLVIAPESVAFGSVGTNCFSARRDLALYNTCATPVTITSFGMVAGAGLSAGEPGCLGTMPCPEFVVDGTPSFSPGQVVPANSTMPLTFALKYRPLDLGPDTGGYLVKASERGSMVDYLVALSGQGATSGTNVDTWLQPVQPKLDLLVVVDDSTAMADKQAAAPAQLAVVAQTLEQAGVLAQLGVVRADVAAADAGVLIGDAMNPRVLPMSGAATFVSRLTPKLTLGTSGGPAHPAEAAVKALSMPLIANQNAGLVRADAVLAVLVVTASGDQSPSAAVVYENQLRQVKGSQNPQLLSYSVMGPFNTPQANCPYGPFTGLVTHQALTTAFNGVREDVCSTSWAQSLIPGQLSASRRDTFFLTALPQSGTLTITVDGQTLPPTDPLGNVVYTYDPVTNSVTFEPLYVPIAGSTITARYTVSCMP